MELTDRECADALLLQINMQDHFINCDCVFGLILKDSIPSPMRRLTKQFIIEIVKDHKS